MKKNLLSAAALSAWLFLLAAQTSLARPLLPNLDARPAAALPAVVAPEKSAAVEKLRDSAPGVKVEFEPVSGAPKRVSSAEGFLTGPDGKGGMISAKNLAGFSAADPHRVTKAFLDEHTNLFGHGAAALAAARIRRDDVTAHSGLHTVVWEQQVDGIAVFEGTLISHTTGKGELVSLSSQFISNPDAAATRGTPGRASLVATPIVSARQAVALAARNIGEKIEAEMVSPSGDAAADAERRQKFNAAALKGAAEAKLIWLPMDKDNLRLCWDVVLTGRTRDEMFRTLVDARMGGVLVRRCLTSYISNASYSVFTSDSPSPFSPGWSTPTNLQPAVVARTLVTLPALDTNASPAGWIPDGANETLGNNVDAHTDRNNDDVADLPRPQGSPFRVFDFSMDLTTQDPTNYASAAVVQLFYLCNWYHDKLYALGFTEAAGNFQTTNFNRGGSGNDAVQADALDGGGTDNANFDTPPDGSPGRMQMYIWSGPSPRRDGGLDAEIVFHEATHGLSWRLVGGGQALSTMQSDGMGEGWSDFYALALLSEAGDGTNGNFAMAAYATRQLGGLSQNYYYGIRRYPYSTDLAKNPLTFKDIDPAQASAHSGIPRSPIIGGAANEVHNSGAVWCATLMEARANLIAKYGWATGNQLMLQITTDGMKLTAPQPNFLQARDAILLADQVDNSGANQIELWRAFAKRGLGFSAMSPVSTTTVGLVEAYDLPVFNAPVIATQPASQTALAGAAVTLFAAVSGQPPFVCQWRFNSTNIFNATNLALVLTGVTASQAGNYSLFVSNNFGAVTSSIAVLTVGANDFCSGAIVISGNAYTNLENTAAATSAGDPLPYCAAQFGKGIWYVFTPPRNGTLVLDTRGSGFDTVLEIFTGSCGGLNPVNCDDDSGGSQISAMTNSVAAGTACYILAGGYGGASGNLLLHANFTATPVIIGSVALNAGHQLQFQISGQPGDVYRVQASTNLPNDWQTLASVTNDLGTAQFTDTSATNLARRFYRAVMP